ncbi:TlpA family protein disulfide reductase [Helicovermis profundi]|uniref:Thioredoxin domain-containing protein n=1 Tax=Helicovermis profundi TaxID=3065157 RepID=A0AAU9EB80_9FIRM|nr:hypothetical protein HLPR_08950 [Clostridia bacterium S502]
MKKKFVVAIILGLLILSLVACSTSTQKEDTVKNDLSKNTEVNKNSDNSVDSTKESNQNNDTSSEKFYVEKGITIEKDKPLPNFVLEGLDGSIIDLSKYKGEYVILNFWATWCKYCKTEMPDLEEFQKNHEDFTLIAINVDEPKDIVKKYIEDGGYTFEVALDKGGNVAKEYGISAYPTSYFLDKDGKLIGVVQGMMTKDGLNDVYDYINKNY